MNTAPEYSTTIHMSQSVEGPLNNWSPKQWDDACEWMTQENGGKFASGLELRAAFIGMLRKGIKCFPLGTCDNFDYQTGCKGHRKLSPSLPTKPYENSSETLRRRDPETPQSVTPGPVLEVKPTPSPLPQNARAMNITARVTERMEKVKALSGQDPDIVFLGEKEWHEMKKAAEPFVKMHDPTAHESRRAEFKGMKIYRVDADTFLSVGFNGEKVFGS